MSNITEQEIEELAEEWFQTADKKNIIFDLGWMKIFEAGYKTALQNKVSNPVKILSEEEFSSIISTGPFNNIRSSQFKKGMYAGYLETVSKEYVSVNGMSNITDEIEKLSGIMSKLGEAHNMLAKTSLSKEEYQPISGLLAKAKVELFNFYNGHKAALQNKVSEKCKHKSLADTGAGYYYCPDCDYRWTYSEYEEEENQVSDISAEEILYKHILADSEKQMSGDKRLVIKDPPFEEIVKNPTFQMHVAAMKEYASIVNERKDSAGSSETSNEVLNEVLGIAVKAHLFKQLTQMDDFIEEMKKFENFEIKKK